METNSHPDKDLVIAERAAAAPWIDTPLPPRSWAPAGAVLVAALVFLLGELENWHSAAWTLSILTVVVLVGVWVGWGYARLGAMARLRSAPPEFVPLVRWYHLVNAGLAALVVLLFLTVGSRVAAVVTAVGLYLLLTVYTRRSTKAAETVRSRLQ